LWEEKPANAIPLIRWKKRSSLPPRWNSTHGARAAQSRGKTQPGDGEDGGVDGGVDGGMSPRRGRHAAARRRAPPSAPALLRGAGGFSCREEKVDITSGQGEGQSRAAASFTICPMREQGPTPLPPFSGSCWVTRPSEIEGKKNAP